MRPVPFLFLLGVLSLSACNGAKPKAQGSGPSSAEPIPTDLVFNSFMDDKNGAKLAIVSDAGSAGTAAVPSGKPSSVKLDNAGADPKAPLVYAFSPKTRTVNATIKISQNGQEQPFKFTFTATPKAKFGLSGDATIDLKITKVEISLPPGAPPQAATAKEQVEKAFVGTAGHMDASAHGDVTDLQFEASKAQGGAAELTNLVQQALELLVVPVPDEAVGIGAKWSKNESKHLADEGTTVSSNVTATLIARDAQTATLKVEGKNSGTIAVNDPRAPKGTQVQRTATSSYTVTIRFDGVSQKVDGASANDIIQKSPGQADQAVTIKISQNLDSK